MRLKKPPVVMGRDMLPVERTSQTGIVGKQMVLNPDAMKDLVRFATWHITLVIQKSKDTDDIRHRVYYMRCANANEAIMVAVKYWQKWEAPKDPDGHLIPGAFPDIACHPHNCVAMAIDEKDFMNAWKTALAVEAKGKRMEYAGEKVRPVHFTFAESELYDVINNTATPETWGKKTKRKGRV